MSSAHKACHALRIKATLACLVAFLLAIGSATSAADASPAARHLTGTLPDGATWIADVPTDWNGTLVLFSHGFRPPSAPDNPASNAPEQAVADALLARGFALAGSSYAHTGWALDTAVADQLDTLTAVSGLIGRPQEVIAFGQSMGGLVSALLAERAGDQIDGTLTTCGLVAGALNLNNHQLDGTYALARLLLPGQQVKLTKFTSVDEANATVTQLTGALEQAQQSAAGRARIALAAALMNAPTWYTGTIPPAATDWAAQEQAQYEWLKATLPFVVPARITINAVAGGDSSWNAGVNYGQLVHKSAHFPQIAALYRLAGLNLGTDLGVLTRGATITPDPAAVDWLARTSTPTGRLEMPELALHTVADNLAPVEFEREYAEKVGRAGDARMLRQAYVARVGHCRFTPAEQVASLLALQTRIRTGTWGDRTDPAKLQAAAEALNLGGAAFDRYRPAPFVNDRADRLFLTPR